MGRGDRLLARVGSKRKQQAEIKPRHRREDGSYYDPEQARKDADKGWRLYRALKEKLRLREIAEKIHKFVLATWILFFAFLKDFDVLSPEADAFLSREEVIAAGGFIISWCIYRVYRMGPWGVAIFTIIACVVTVLVFTGVI